MNLVNADRSKALILVKLVQIILILWENHFYRNLALESLVDEALKIKLCVLILWCSRGRLLFGVESKIFSIKKGRHDRLISAEEELWCGNTKKV